MSIQLQVDLKLKHFTAMVVIIITENIRLQLMAMGNLYKHLVHAG